MDDKLQFLCNIFDDFAILAASDNKFELQNSVKKYMSEYRNDTQLYYILRNLDIMISEIINCNTNNLSAEERSEYDEVNRLIDNNFFNYHFQPIVDTKNGDIYSFEALMRPNSNLCRSPLSVLKYAELSGRLVDIEKATFSNVLKLVADNSDKIGNKRVFINSISKIRLNDDDFNILKPVMCKFSDNIVIEMTEQFEAEDRNLDAIKNKYSNLGIKFAIDDYGTGYSNVQNLIRYAPDYVKIDRSLINNVDTDSKKQYFVRDIIEFCHDNNIMALAEGVETTEELHTVIKLGADLIQGYYTARPSGEFIESISEDVRNEIKNYRKERDREKELGIYVANNVDKIYIKDIAKDYTCVQIKSNKNFNINGSIVLTGRPETSNGMHVVIDDDFCGELILECITLSNNGNKPCIEIGENSDVTLIFNGLNELIHGGIKVPESSSLRIKGEGILSLFVDGSSFYAIGNDKDSKHGKLIFDQGVCIKNDSVLGVCIGSGLGGDIIINKGKFELSMRGINGIAIGSYTGDSNVDINGSDINIDFNLQNGVGIGSIAGSVNLDITHSSVRMRLSGSNIIGIGNFEGNICKTDICEASVIVNIMADDCSAIASKTGSTVLNVQRASLGLLLKGRKSFAVGYPKNAPVISLVDSDFNITLITDQRYVRFLKSAQFSMLHGRISVVVNDTDFYHKD